MNHFPEICATGSIEDQQRIRDKCRHPSGEFVCFERSEIDQSIPRRFEKQVRRYPDSIAIQSKNDSLSYKDLNTTADKIAHIVMARCKENVETVSLLFGHNSLMIAAILGVLKAGKMYVPLDSTFPQARLSYILQDSQSNLILTDSRNLPLAGKLASQKHQLLNVDELDSSTILESTDLSFSPDAPIYILYTSGSTGQPKGVVQTHRHRLHDIMIHSNGLHICPDDRLVMLYSCSTGMGATVLFSALLNGAGLYLYNLKENGIAELPQWLIQHRITIYTSITTVLRQFFNALKGHEQFPDLRVIYQSGEPMFKRDVAEYRKFFPDSCILVNGIGAGEIARLRRYYIEKTSVIAGNVVPVGYPVEDKEVILLDENRRGVSYGQIGEIAVKSRFLSPGYWQRSDLTDRAFISKTEWGEERMYLTGDLGCMTADGCLTHMGRKDFQVKIRGNRVEIPEIEARLHALESIDEAVVVVEDEGDGEQRLVAYVVVTNTVKSPAAFLRESLAESLPEHMIPSFFVFLDALPHLPNGKIDRRALPAFDRHHFDSARSTLEPRDDLESGLVDIWKRVLKITRVGVTDNFFELGGDSLGAMLMSVEIEKTFGRSFPLGLLCEAPTIDQIARRFRQDEWAWSWSSIVPLRSEGTKPPFFCVHGVGGYVLFLRELSRSLCPDQPFYGLQAIGLEGNRLPPERIEDIAAHYLAEVRSAQPQGPYFLGGFCLGTYIIFEMAQQLRSQGQDVAVLAAFNPPGQERMPASAFWGFRLHFENLSQLETDQKAAYMLERAAFRLGRIKNFYFNSLYRISMLCGWSGRSLPARLHRFHVQELYHEAGQNYLPKQYPGKLIFFLGASHVYRHPELFWRDFAKEGVDVYEIPGHRDEIFKEPNVRILSSKLAAILENFMQTESREL